MESNDTRQSAENKNIVICWWNMGTRTLDHKGTVKEYINKRRIKVRKILHPFHKDIKGLRFTIPLSSTLVKLDTFDGNDYSASFDKAIIVFLTLLGDKAKFESSRDYLINWN